MQPFDAGRSKQRPYGLCWAQQAAPNKVREIILLRFLTVTIPFLRLLLNLHLAVSHLTANRT